MSEGITFQAIVSKVQTLQGGGVRVTLDLADTDLDSGWKLARLREQLVQVGVVVVRPNEEASAW